MKKNEKIGRRRFIGKIVAITGGAHGIGKNIARKFALEGATIVICDIDKASGEATVNEFRRNRISADFLIFDLAAKDGPKKMIQRIVKKWSRIDVLVNNARAGNRVELLDESEANWDKAVSVMLRGPFFAAQEAVRSMARTGGGSIVNISSVAGIESCAESPGYHAAKAGLLQITKYLAGHAGRYGVRVNSVLPGFIVKDEHVTRYESKGNEKFRSIAEFCHPLGRVGAADEVADAVLFLCSGEAAFITGDNIVIDGGLTIQDQSDLLYRFDQRKK